MQSVYLQRIMKKNSAKGYKKTNPKQTQFLKRPKMNANAFPQKDYENETTHRPKKTNPNKANFRKAKMNRKNLKKHNFPKIRLILFLDLVNLRKIFMVLTCSVPIRCSCKRSFFYMTFLLKELSHSVTVPPIFDLTEEL